MYATLPESQVRGLFRATSPCDWCGLLPFLWHERRWWDQNPIVPRGFYSIYSSAKISWFLILFLGWKVNMVNTCKSGFLKHMCGRRTWRSQNIHMDWKSRRSTVLGWVGSIRATNRCRYWWWKPCGTNAAGGISIALAVFGTWRGLHCGGHDVCLHGHGKQGKQGDRAFIAFNVFHSFQHLSAFN